MSRFSPPVLALVILAVVPCSLSAQLAPELVRQGKRATALVEIRVDGGVGFGSAFCIDKSGLFVTNAHVVEGAEEAGQVKLVLYPGEKEQRVVKARVVRASDDLDLAILKIDADTALTALELGKDDDLVETTPVTAFGFPFGKAMAVVRGGYPSVSVNRSTITSLKKVNGRLALVQIDGLMNPGNSGGPLLDPSGKVIGVVAAGVLGAGINFAIAVGRLSEYIASPLITFDPPPLTHAERSRSADWTIKVASATPGAKLPDDLAVAVTIEGGTAAPRKSMARAVGGGNYKIAVVPVPRDPERRVTLMVVIGGRFLRGTVVDRNLKINGKTVALGDLRQLWSGPPPRATLADGRSASGPIVGLGKVRLRTQAGDEVQVDLAGATSITVDSVGQAPTVVAIEVVIDVKEGPKVLGTAHKRIPIRGAEQFAAATGGERPRGVVTPVQVVQGPNDAESLVDVGGVLDAREGGLGSAKAIRPPTIAIGEARVDPEAPTETGGEVRRFVGHGGGIWGVALSPDGTRAATTSHDSTVRVWDTATGRELRCLRGHADHTKGVAFTPDGLRVLSGSDDDTLRLWDLATGAQIRQFKGHTGDVSGAVAVSPDGRRTLSGADDQTVRLWDLETGRELQCLKGHAKRVSKVAFLPDGRQAVSVSEDGTMRLWDLAAGREVRLFQPGGPLQAVAVTPDGLLAVTGGNDGKLRIWDLATGDQVRHLDGHADGVTCVAITPDGRRAVSAAWDKDRKLRYWNLEAGREIAAMAHPAWVSSVAIARDGRHVVTGCGDNIARLWLLPDAAPPGPAARAAEPLERKLPDKISAVAVGGAGRYLLLTLHDARKLAVFDVNAAEVVKLIPLPSGDALVAAGAEKFVILFRDQKLIQRWDLATLTREATKPSPIHGRVKAIAMGSDSDGPVLAHWDLEGNNNLLSPQFFSFLDPGRLKVLKVRSLLLGNTDSPNRRASSGGAWSIDLFSGGFNIECQIRASASGSLFGLWRTSGFPSGFASVAVDGTTVETCSDSKNWDSLVPGPDGRSLFTAGDGVVTARGEPVIRVAKDPATPQPDPSPYLPSTDPMYYLVIKGLPPSFTPRPRPAAPLNVSVFLVGNKDPLTTITHLDEMADLAVGRRWYEKGDVASDRRFHWVPSANLLITIPTSNDRLVLRRFDVSKAIESQTGDYLFVTSPASVAAAAGKPLSHQIVVKSKKGKVTYVLNSGPAGMTVSPGGLVTWEAPAANAGDDEVVIFTVGDASGQEVFHTLSVRVR